MSRTHALALLAYTDCASLEVNVPQSAVTRLAVLLEPFVMLKRLSGLQERWRVELLGEVSADDVDLSWKSIGKFNEPVQLVVVDDARKTLLLSCADPQFSILLVARVVTHLLRIESLRAGHEFLHAAAISTATGAIVLAGDKKCGKTTLTMALLRQAEIDFISNDNVSLCWNDGQWMSYGWPRSLRIRCDTLPALGLVGKDHGLPEVTLAHPLNGKCSLPVAAEQPMPNVLHVFPFELSVLLGRRVVRSQPLRAIIFLSPTDGPGTPEIGLLSGDEARRAYRLQAYPGIELPGLSHAAYLNHLLDEVHGPIGPDGPAEHVPCYRLRHGLNDIATACRLILQSTAEQQ